MKFVIIAAIELLAEGGIFLSDPTARKNQSIIHNA